MIYGDPFKFALQFDVVDAWNIADSEWRNGIFALYVNGARLFALVDPVELRTTFNFFKKTPLNEVKFGSAYIDTKKVFENAYEYFLGGGNDLAEGVVSLTCTAMSDGDLNLYLMKLSCGDRLIWSFDHGETVSEHMLEMGEVASVVDDMPPSLTN
jgi:hypothetical protein